MAHHIAQLLGTSQGRLSMRASVGVVMLRRFGFFASVKFFKSLAAFSKLHIDS